MERVVEKLALSKNIIKEAEKLLRSLCKEGFCRYRSYILVGLGCLYYQIKRDPNCLAISLQKFIKATSYTRKEICKIYNQIVAKKGIPAQICTIRPTIYVKKFGEKLGLSKRALAYAIRLSEEMIKRKIHLGKNPLSLAATCLYIANLRFNEGRTQGEISEVFNIEETGMTIRKISKLPFFVEKMKDIEYGTLKIINKEILSELIPKLFKKPQFKQGILFVQLRRNLRYFFPEETKGYAIPYGRLNEIVRGLDLDGILKLTPGSECIKRPPKEHCRYCDKIHCIEMLVQPPEPNHL